MQWKSVLTGAALAFCPALASAQPPESAFAFHDWTGSSPIAKPAPACTYKGAMSDTEIERCVGHAVHYDYAPRPAGAAAKGPRHPVRSG
jgi:hypothetical protein